MFEAPFVLSRELMEAFMRLPSDTWRLFVHVLLDVTADRAHPYWALRPLSITTLREIWPGERPHGAEQNDTVRSLRGAVETELAARCSERLIDTVGVIERHSHPEAVQRRGGCIDCAHALTSPAQPDVEAIIRDVLAARDSDVVPRYTVVYAEELAARGWWAGTVHRRVRRWVTTYEDLTESFCPDIDEIFFEADDDEHVTLVRRVEFDRPGSFSPRTAFEPIEDVRFVATAGEVFLQVTDVSSRPRDRGLAIDRLNTAGEIWSAYLRLAIPGRDVTLADAVAVGPSYLSVARRPEHRRFWSVEDASINISRLVSARSRFGAVDRARLDAAVTWAGLAMSLWNDAPVRSLALVWMALEALFGSARNVYESAPAPYLRRLPIETGNELARHVGRRRAVDRPTWAERIGHPKQGTIREYVARLHDAVRDRKEERLLADRASKVLSLFDRAGTATARDRVLRDLHFISAVRNAIAHTGRPPVSAAVAQYLMNVGMEVLKAMFVETISRWEKAEQSLSIDDIVDSCLHP